MGIETNYRELYGAKYVSKMENLKKQIIEGDTDDNTFKVIDIEAGLGKSVETNRIIREYLLSFQFAQSNFSKTNRKFLIVKPFAKDVLDTERAIAGVDEQLNNRYRQSIIGITKDNWRTIRLDEGKLLDADVIIITHSRYKILCSNTEMRALLTQGRHIIIIDERIDFPKYTFTKETYKQMVGLLDTALLKDLADICSPLFNEIKRIRALIDNKEYSLNEIIKARPKFGKKDHYKLDKFISDVYRNMQYLDEDEDYLQGANKVKDFINSLKCLYHNDYCYYNNNTLTGWNRDDKLWGLNNNIILDANGSFEALYSSDDKWLNKFVLNKQSNIVNHRNSSITQIQYNSSASNIKANEEYYFEEIVKLMHDKRKNNEKTLIVLQKKFVTSQKGDGSFINKMRESGINDIFIGSESEDDIRTINDERYAVTWFGNIIGKNEWKDFNQCWIIGTPNIPLQTHIINLAQYSGRAWNMSRKITSQKGKGFKFKHDTYDKIRQGYIIGEIYQSVKRIQRNEQPRGQIFIVNSDETIFNKIVRQLANIRITEPIKINTAQIEDNQPTTVRQDDGAIAKKKQILSFILNSKRDLTKEEIALHVDIPKSHLSRYLKKSDALFKGYIDAKLFSIEHHKVKWQ